MKKFIVLLVALCVASTAFAADFMWSWDTDWGWTSNFDDVYAAGVDELELGLEVEFDDYNVMATQIEPAAAVGGLYDYFKITTDLAEYFGLPVGVTWVNGYTDPGDEEYSDVLRVGLQNAGLTVGLTKDFSTDVNLDFGTFWASVAAGWNIAGANQAFVGDVDGAAVVEPDLYKKEILFLVGAVDLVPGLSFEVGVDMEDLATGVDTDDDGDFDIVGQAEETKVQFDAAYVYGMDGMDLTVAGSFSNWSEAEVYVYGAGVGVDYMVDDATTVNASVEMQGDDDEAFRQLGGGVGVAAGDFGVDVDMAYAVAATADVDIDGVNADGDLLGVDLSGYINIGEAQFRVGYAVTDFGWNNNANGGAGVPTEGGAYMVFTADF